MSDIPTKTLRHSPCKKKTLSIKKNDSKNCDIILISLSTLDHILYTIVYDPGFQL